MEFTLFYKGHISTKEKVKVKHKIRRAFHSQLLKMRELPPLIDHPEWFQEPFPEELHKTVGGNDFICLVSHKLKMYVDLQITLYSAYKNRSFKDIDNKLKILFDALQMPRVKGEIPVNWTPEKKEKPLLCLLSDDKLIYKLHVDTDFILQEDFFEKEEMACIIKIKIKSNKFSDQFRDLMV
jgi:hypothetical protein